MFLFKKKSKAMPAPEPLVLEEKPVIESPSVELDAATLAKDTPKRRRPASAGKTRLMGFDTSDGRVVDLFGEDQKTAETSRMQFPVALVMIVKGPGLGECFALKSGMSQIGRGDDQAIQLDFGDMAVSRSNHAAVVYDPKEHTFLLGHGGKSNIVRLNGKPVVSTSDLKNGDEIEIGQTKMRFVALCSDEFNWENAEREEGGDDDDMEIA